MSTSIRTRRSTTSRRKGLAGVTAAVHMAHPVPHFLNKVNALVITQLVCLQRRPLRQFTRSTSLPLDGVIP